MVNTLELGILEGVEVSISVVNTLELGMLELGIDVECWNLGLMYQFQW